MSTSNKIKTILAALCAATGVSGQLLAQDEDAIILSSFDQITLE